MYFGVDGLMFADSINKKIRELEELRREVETKKVLLDAGLAEMRRVLEVIKNANTKSNPS